MLKLLRIRRAHLISICSHNLSISQCELAFCLLILYPFPLGCYPNRDCGMKSTINCSDLRHDTSFKKHTVYCTYPITVGCLWNAIQNNIILHISLHLVGQNIDPSFEFPKDIPYLALTGVFYEDFSENWLRHKGIKISSWCQILPGLAFICRVSNTCSRD